MCSAFGAWPVATMARDARKVVVRGPACGSSAVTGWFSMDFSGNGTAATTARPPEVDAHGFAFNSSVLWDPERWGRYPTSEPDKSQVSLSPPAIYHPPSRICRGGVPLCVCVKEARKLAGASLAFRTAAAVSVRARVAEASARWFWPD